MCVVMTLAMTSACGMSEEIDTPVDEVTTTQTTQEEIPTTQSDMTTEDTTSEEQTTERDITITEQNTEKEQQGTQPSVSTEETAPEAPTTDMYVGTYYDYDNNDPNLMISLNEDGTYSVAVGIFRLTTLEDGIGTLTDKGLEFVATDASGNPIEGVITLEGNEAVVTFTNSTWELIANGDAYRYVKANDM